MNKQNKNKLSTVNELIQQYQQDLTGLSQDITAQSRTIVDIRNRLQTLNTQLNTKTEETQYAYKVDLDKLSEGILGKCRAEKSYSENLQAQIGKLENQNIEAKATLDKLEKWVGQLAQIVGS